MENDYEVDYVTKGNDVIEITFDKEYDLYIFDINVPDIDGLEILKSLRDADDSTPAIFISAMTDLKTFLKGFEVGADDYLTKPFSMEELLLRIKAIMRRSISSDNDNKNSVFNFGTYTFEYNRQTLTNTGTEQKLTSKEAELLKLLCENMNNVLDRTVALNKIWFDDSYFNARSMDVYITKLRKYLKGDPNVELINVHGVGFKLVVSE